LAAASLKAQAIRLLARREHARAEIEAKLLARGHDKAEVRAVLDELARLGYLSDARYARSLAGQKAGRYSRRGIAAELKARGVAQSDIDAAIAEAGIDDEQSLAALWQRRYGHPPEDEREKARQVRFLQSRGFSLSAILKLLRTISGR
jgi:regulatory protein